MIGKVKLRQTHQNLKAAVRSCLESMSIEKFLIFYWLLALTCYLLAFNADLLAKGKIYPVSKKPN